MVEILAFVTCCEGKNILLVIIFLHLMVIDCEVEYPINHHFACDALSELIIYSLPHMSSSYQVTFYSYHHVTGSMELKRNSSSELTLLLFGPLVIIFDLLVNGLVGLT